MTQLREVILAGLVVLVGIAHASLYALVMPPWGLLDESQHFHYTQFITETGQLPIMWQDMLSDEVIDSIFAVERYVTLGGETMPNRADIIVPGRLDSESYQAHHPPLYYLTLAAVYPWSGADVLTQLFVLRLVGVLLSGITLILVGWSTRQLWPGQPWIALVAMLFIALHPERAASAGRLSNDVMLELTSAAAFAILAWAIRHGPTWRLALLLTITLGLSVLTKISALLIIPPILMGWWWLGRLNQHTTYYQIGVIMAGVTACLIPLVARNMILYQDPTGLGAFIAQMGPLVDGPLAERVVVGSFDLLRHSWVILWDGGQATGKPSGTLLQITLIGLSGFLAYRLGRVWLTHPATLAASSRIGVSVGLSAIVLVSAATLHAYVSGQIPVVQGRFLLPVTVPTAWLMGFSLWLVWAQWRQLFAGVLFILETTASLSVLFFHALPKFYAPRDTGFLGYWAQTSYLFYDPRGMFWDKPDFITPMLVFGMLGLFGGGWIGATLIWWRIYGWPTNWFHLKAVWDFIQSYHTPPERLPQPRFNGWAWFGSPLLWTGVVLVIGYTLWVMYQPPEIFWSLDEGGKYIHVKSIIATSDPTTPLLYPGRYLDQRLEFVPLFYWSQQDNAVYSWWPVGFQLITVPFYWLFGWLGLYIIPVISGAITAILSGLLVRYLAPGSRWLDVAAAVIVGVATPVTFYSTLFWEHTLNVALIMGALLLIGWAWRYGQARLIVVAGVLLGLATYFRTDTGAIVAGIGLVMLVFYWRWAMLLGVSYTVTSVAWLGLNLLLMEQTIGGSGADNVFDPRLFRGFNDAGLWFVPYSFFTSPKITSFDMGPALLSVGMLALVLAVLTPFLGRFRWWGLGGYAVLCGICGWVLIHPAGYRSIHGLVMIAPHVVFAAWLYAIPETRRDPLMPLLILGAGLGYASAYLLKAWEAAGGLQWGPRYMLAFYPLLVAASLVGLVQAWPLLSRAVRHTLLGLYLLSVIIGVGYQMRGLDSALQTKQHFVETHERLQTFHQDAIITECRWLTMVIPDLYWDGTMFSIHGDADFDHWVYAAQQVNLSSVCRVYFDICDANLQLDDIRRLRATNPGGLTAQCFSQTAGDNAR